MKGFDPRFTKNWGPMVDKKWSQNKFGGKASATVFTLTPILDSKTRVPRLRGQFIEVV